jgi:hypothetical protein
MNPLLKMNPNTPQQCRSGFQPDPVGRDWSDDSVPAETATLVVVVPSRLRRQAGSLSYLFDPLLRAFDRTSRLMIGLRHRALSPSDGERMAEGRVRGFPTLINQLS